MPGQSAKRSLRKRSSSASLSELQWLLLARMLERNYSVRDAFESLSRTYPSSRAIRNICSGLNEGISLARLLGSSPFERELSFYVDFLSLDKSIMVVSRQLKKEKTIVSRFAGKIGYQVMLLLASFGLLFLFSQIVLPNMMSMLALADERSQSVMAVFRVMNMVRDVLLILIVLFVLFVLYIVIRKRENYLWVYLHHHGLDRPLKVYATYRFVIRLNCMLENGISLIDALNVLRHDDSTRMVNLLAHHFDEVLLNGVDFEKSLDMAYFDDDFHSLCLLGIRSDDFNQALEDYEYMVELKLDRILTRLSSVIQAVCYLFVAAVITMGYQVLLLPLQLLQEY